MTNESSLIEKTKKQKGRFLLDKDDFIPIIHDFYLVRDSKGMRDFLESFAKVYFRTCNYKPYTCAFTDARNRLGFFAEMADKRYIGKGSVKKFYEKAVNHRELEYALGKVGTIELN